MQLLAKSIRTKFLSKGAAKTPLERKKTTPGLTRIHIEYTHPFYPPTSKVSSQKTTRGAGFAAKPLLLIKPPTDHSIENPAE